MRAIQVTHLQMFFSRRIDWLAGMFVIDIINKTYFPSVIMQAAKVLHDFRGFVFHASNITPAGNLCRSRNDLLEHFTNSTNRQHLLLALNGLSGLISSRTFAYAKQSVA
ncbi:Uncharacterised protein [Serratia fonticola]|nr:Uncharacterised protein [Serratia fonticola]